MIKAILFDFGQTLVDSAAGFRAAEKELQKRIFSEIDPDDRGEPRPVFWENFLENYRRIRTRFQENSDFSRKALSVAVYRHFGRDANEKRLERWESDYWERVTQETREFPEARQVLRALSAVYRLAVITNTQGQKVSGSHRLHRFPELMKYFETVVVAGDGGIPEKPDPAPFRLCLERLGIPASQSVYVGDDWRIDIPGARSAGIHPVWLQHRSVKRNWPRPDGVQAGVPIIQTLDALLDLESIV